MMKLSTEWDWRLLPQYNFTNLQYALDCTTPAVPLTLIPKSAPARSCTEESWWADDVGSEVEGCFRLSDFWESYEQWSACGARVPIKLPSGDCLLQYYWPSLSALQLYTRPSVRMPSKTISTTKSERDAFNDKETGSSSEDHPRSETADEMIEEEEVGELCCQYNDIVNPHARPPFTQRVKSLIKKYPQMVTLKSSDLTSHSWVAVAWYPVYRVPICTVMELNASFVTFHKLSSTSPCTNRMLPVVETEKIKHERAHLGMEANASAQRPPKTGVIPPFAMSTYKMSGELWFNPGTDDLQTAIGYQQTAWRWIKQHNFNHHDFNFFMTRGIRM